MECSHSYSPKGLKRGNTNAKHIQTYQSLDPKEKRMRKYALIHRGVRGNFNKQSYIREVDVHKCSLNDDKIGFHVCMRVKF